MNNIFDLKIDRITKKGNVTIINDQYVIKENSTNYYEYLPIRGFNYFPDVVDTKDNYILTKYIFNKDIPISQRLEDMIYLVSILHNTTKYNKEVDIDTIKEMYESIINRHDELMKYYLGLQDLIENEEYMNPSSYLLIRNISLIYKSIKESRKYLDKWYKEIENNKNIRYSYVHGNLDINHLLEDDNLYLISWDKSRIDLPIYDIDNFYRKNYKDIELNNLLSIYNKKYVLSNMERNLLFSILLIPKKIELSGNEYLCVKNVTYLLLYLEELNNSINHSTKEDK